MHQKAIALGNQPGPTHGLEERNIAQQPGTNLLQLTIALLRPIAGDPKRSPKVAEVCFFKEAEP